jgi:hypothetical protein
LAGGFDPREFLELAKNLVSGDTPTQAQLRTAVSRAYYATHLAGRERLSETGKFSASGTGEDHLNVIAVLKSMDGALGDQLDRLRILRNRADYNLLHEFQANDTKFAVSLAESLIGEIRELPI